MTISEKSRIKSMHPGEYLNEVVCALGLERGLLATELGMPVRTLEQVLSGKRDISPEFALRLDRYFGSGIRMWLDLQNAYSLELTEQKYGRQIEEQVIPLEREVDAELDMDEFEEVVSRSMFECTALPIGTDGGPPAGLFNGMPPIHPGEFITEEIEYLGSEIEDWEKAMGVESGNLRAIIDEERDIDAQMALRLSRFFSSSVSMAELWMNLQASYSAKIAERDLGPKISDEVQPRERRLTKVSQVA